MSLYLGENLISGVASPVEPTRNIGQIIQSTIPLTDAGLHLLDGSLILGSGSYSAFVNYIADLYTADPTANYFMQEYTEDLPFSQPVLSANGTMGGSSFACAASSEYNSSYQAYMAFDSNTTGTDWASASFPNWITFYNPDALNVTKLTIINRSSGDSLSAGVVYGSNDNSTWTELKTFANSITGGSQVWEINLSDNTGYYKYYKIEGTSHTGYASTGMSNIAVTATYKGNTYTPEQAWQQQVSTYGVCGKFVYDSINNTVRLPKVTGFVEGASGVSTLGNLTEAGLPNHNHLVQRNTFNYKSGAVPASSYTVADTLSATQYYTETVSGSSIYGNSNTVQPQTIKVLYYIVIATSTKTDIEVDIDEIATDLNGKADTDLTNVSNTSGFRKLVEVYNNGASWYKVYSEYNPTTGTYIGQWCEQGGTDTSQTGKTISFLKPFRDINYTLAVALNLNNSGSPLWSDFGYSRTTTGFTVRYSALSWQACGYIS